MYHRFWGVYIVTIGWIWYTTWHDWRNLVKKWKYTPCYWDSACSVIRPIVFTVLATKLLCVRNNHWLCCLRLVIRLINSLVDIYLVFSQLFSFWLYQNLFVLIYTVIKRILIFNHREFFFWLAIYVDMWICMYVFSIEATPFNLQLWNFGITFLMWLSKTFFFSNFWKIVFSRVIAPFLYFFKISL